MDRPMHDWFPALLTAASFLAGLSTTIVALLDALEGSRSATYELGLAVLCGAAFATLLRTLHVDDDVTAPRTTSHR